MEDIKLVFVGDVVLQEKPVFSQELSDLIGQADISSCNFEAPLEGAGHATEKIGPLVSQSRYASKWICELGFNLFNLANNHIYDYGDGGMNATKEALPEKSVLGVGVEKDAYALMIKEVAGTTLGFVAYGENGYGALDGERSTGYAWVNHMRVDNDIRNYKKAVDVLIVQVHAGVEHLDVPIPEWRERYYELIDAGADLIVAHHPHILQGIEMYKGKYICYSLGNFCFDYDSTAKEWNKGGVLAVRLLGRQIKEIELRVCVKKGKGMSLLSREDSQQKIAILNTKLTEDYLDYVNEQAVRLFKAHHIGYYAKIANGISCFSIKSLLKHVKRMLFNRKINVNMLWHNLFIESNLWLVKRAVQRLNSK